MATGEQEGAGNSKLVSVGESIRYRKRAQSAERRVEELAGELSESRAEATRLADELKGVQKDQELTKRLVAAGARDLEAAVLIAKSRLGQGDKTGSTGSPQADLNGVVEQLKKEKQYLFPRLGSGQVSETVTGGVPTTTFEGKQAPPYELRQSKSREVEPECLSGRRSGRRGRAAGRICRSI